MIITYKSFAKIEFPVFQLPSDNWDYNDGLFRIDGAIVDDRNCAGDTLGKRRLQTPLKTLEIKQSISSPVGLIKNVGGKPYIDWKGRFFIYEKTIMTRLKYHKILKVERKTIGSSLKLQGVSTRFAVPRPPDADMEWAGILYFYGLPWMLYEFSQNRKKDRRVKV